MKFQDKGFHFHPELNLQYSLEGKDSDRINRLFASVKAATLIFISGRGLAISSATCKEGKSDSF